MTREELLKLSEKEREAYYSQLNKQVEREDAAKKLKLQQQELIDYSKRKAREAKRTAEKAAKIKVVEQYLASKLSIDWILDKSNYYDGILQEQKLFQIKKGLTIYTLYIKDKEIAKTHKKLWYTGIYCKN